MSTGLRSAGLRIARPTDNLDAVVAFYRDALGFSEVGGFKNHDGFDGVMLGHVGAPFHFEFTHHRGHVVGRAPTSDHLLVFYVDDDEARAHIVERLRAHGHAPVSSYNPYWNRTAMTFEDPDGYRIVIERGPWPQAPSWPSDS